MLLLAGCAGSYSDTGRAPVTGVSGIALIDGGCPVLRAGTSCPTRPVVARVSVLAEGPDGKAVAEVDTNAAGEFRIGLAPGRYALTGRAADSPTPAKAVAVVVQSGRVTAVRLVFDSGIRGPR
ncbi:MAG TPA: hypothetical protein VFJ97_00925 [Dermatophilaceae bacterium]|nr:hypothetical protein [Dermatophilaceae bacterium]